MEEDQYTAIWEQYGAILGGSDSPDSEFYGVGVDGIVSSNSFVCVPPSPFFNVPPTPQSTHHIDKKIKIDNNEDDEQRQRNEEWERYQQNINERRYRILSDRHVKQTRDENFRYMIKLKVPNNIRSMVMIKWDDYMVFERQEQLRSISGGSIDATSAPVVQSQYHVILNHNHECTTACSKSGYIKCLHSRHNIYVCSESGKFHICRMDSNECAKVSCTNEYSEAQCSISGIFIASMITDDASFYKTDKDRDLDDGGEYESIVANEDLSDNDNSSEIPLDNPFLYDSSSTIDAGGGGGGGSDLSNCDSNSSFSFGEFSDGSSSNNSGLSLSMMLTKGNNTHKRSFFSFGQNKQNRFDDRNGNNNQHKRFHLEMFNNNESISRGNRRRHRNNFVVVPIDSSSSNAESQTLSPSESTSHDNEQNSMNSKTKQRHCFHANDQTLSKSAQSIIFDLLYNSVSRTRIDHRHVNDMKNSARQHVCKYYKNCNKLGKMPIMSMVDNIFRHYMNKKLRLKELKYDRVRIEYYAGIAVRLWKFIINSSFARNPKNEPKFHFRSHVLGLLYMMQNNYSIPLVGLTTTKSSSGSDEDNIKIKIKLEPSDTEITISNLQNSTNLSPNSAGDSRLNSNEDEFDNTIPKEEMDIINGTDTIENDEDNSSDNNSSDSDNDDDNDKEKNNSKVKEEDDEEESEDEDFIVLKKEKIEEKDYSPSIRSSPPPLYSKKKLLLLRYDKFLYLNLPSQSDLKDIPLCDRDDRFYLRNDITKGTNNIKDSIKSVKDVELLNNLYKSMSSERKRFRAYNKNKIRCESFPFVNGGS